MKVGQIYLINMGGGARDNYDVLSKGCEQAKLLENIYPATEAFSGLFGSHDRQRLTAEIVAPDSGGWELCSWTVSDERWNEFQPGGGLSALAGRMKTRAMCSLVTLKRCRRFCEMIRIDGAAGDVTLQWFGHGWRIDIPTAGESWASFRSRIQARSSALAVDEDGGNIAVFTSATPIAISVGAALDLSDERLLGILGALYNAGVTMMRPWRGELRLFTFNSVAHLPAELCTFR